MVFLKYIDGYKDNNIHFLETLCSPTLNIKLVYKYKILIPNIERSLPILINSTSSGISSNSISSNRFLPAIDAIPASNNPSLSRKRVILISHLALKKENMTLKIFKYIQMTRISYLYNFLLYVFSIVKTQKIELNILQDYSRIHALQLCRLWNNQIFNWAIRKTLITSNKIINGITYHSNLSETSAKMVYWWASDDQYFYVKHEQWRHSI